MIVPPLDANKMGSKYNDLHLINEKRKKMVQVLGDDERSQYFQLLQTWFRFKKPASDLEIDNAAQRLLKHDDQWKAHYDLIFAIKAKLHGKSQKASLKSTFQVAEVSDYVAPAQITLPPKHWFERNVASDFFLPNNSFISTRINLHVWENGLQGVQGNVVELMVDLCQMFMKNILTAMISKKVNYKIKGGNFQYAFGSPTLNPVLRNANNVMDFTKESNVDVAEDEDSFEPVYRRTVEHAEQQMAFAYGNSCETRRGGKLTLDLLYDTLRSQPHLLGLHSISSVNLLKLSLQLEEGT